jgi:hypothetical protein
MTLPSRPNLLAVGRIVAALVLIVGCGAGAGTPSPFSPGSVLTTAQLKYALIDRLGRPWFCDPDQYPVARVDPRELAAQHLAEIQADTQTFQLILAHVGIPASASFGPNEQVAIYSEWKALNAITLDGAGDGRLRFDYRAMPAEGEQVGTRSAGTIDPDGAITIDQQAPIGPPPCPICLARGTRIATPTGDVAAEDIRIGMQVWSRDTSGRPIVATVLDIGRTPVPTNHRVVRLVLANGRVVRASPGHPLADGRQLGRIRKGDLVDGVRVVSAELERYDGAATYDLLPSGPTGIYLADGVALGSTLRR